MSESPEVARVRLALHAGEIPRRRDLEHALRTLGFSARKARAFCSIGMRALDPQAAVTELKERLKTLEGLLR